jgi:hypothetical protein
MKIFFGILFSPFTFAIGFLMPLIAQSLLALGVTTQTIAAYATGLILALGLALMAHFRGSWIWIK